MYVLLVFLLECLFMQPLDEASLAELKVALNGFLAKGETIKLVTKVGGLDSELGLHFIHIPLNFNLCLICRHNSFIKIYNVSKYFS